MKHLTIIKTGDSIPSLVDRRGDFEDWIMAGLGDPQPLAQVVAVHRGEALPDFIDIGGIIITGSYDMVTDRLAWSEITAGWLVKAVQREIPILGICFGHQLLAHALGGRVADMPCGPEFGTVPIALTPQSGNDPLFRGFPQVIDVHTSHYQSVAALPPRAILMACSEKDPHIAFRWGSCAWGVQFHPEYDADITDAYRHEFNKAISKSGQNVAARIGHCRDTAAGKIILGNFVAYVTDVSREPLQSRGNPHA